MAESQGKGLWAVLGEVPDTRSRHGMRFELRSVLSIVIGALLCGRTNPASIARWGRQLKAEQLEQLGIDRPQAPCQSTYHYVLKALRVDALEKALGSWVARTGRAGHVCLDGKSLRASRCGPYPALHVLALYSESLKGVIAQRPVGEGHNEISVAMKLLKEVELEGAVLSGDAEFRQRAICREVTDRGGDYFVVVKDNQSALKEQIEAAFAEPFSPLGKADVGSGGLQRSQS